MRVSDKDEGMRVGFVHNGLDRHHLYAGDDAKKHLHLRVRIAAHRVHQGNAAADFVKQWSLVAVEGDPAEPREAPGAAAGSAGGGWAPGIRVVASVRSPAGICVVGDSPRGPVRIWVVGDSDGTGGCGLTVSWPGAGWLGAG